MRHFLAVALIVLGLAGDPVWPALPSADEIRNIKASINELAEDASASELDSLLKEALAEIIAIYGIEGVAYIALSEPVLMEALLLSPSFGYEMVANAVVSVATNTQELEQNLVVVATAQLNVGGVIDEAVIREIVLSNGTISEVSLEPSKVGELVTSVNRSAMNAYSSNNNSDNVRIGESENLRERLADIVEGTQITVDPKNRIISQVR